MLLGIIRCLDAVGDILEYGPVEAVKINTALVPEAERSYREIMKNIDKPILESGYISTVSAPGKVIRDIGRARVSRKRTDVFREAVEKAVRDRMSDNCYSEEHHLQIKDLAYEMHDCLSDFLEKASEKYEEEETFAVCEELPKLDASDYGSGDYDYGRLSQAKVSCRDALTHAVTDMRDYYEEGKRKAAAGGRQFLRCVAEDIRLFLEDFTASYDDYVSLYCEGEARVWAEEMQNEIVGAGTKQYESMKLEEKLDEICKDVFDRPVEKYWDVWAYFDQCDYEEDDESYCYKIEDAVCSLNDMIRECYESACGQMDEQVRKLYQSALDEVADVLSAGLVGLI